MSRTQVLCEKELFVIPGWYSKSIKLSSVLERGLAWCCLTHHLLTPIWRCVLLMDLCRYDSECFSAVQVCFPGHTQGCKRPGGIENHIVGVGAWWWLCEHCELNCVVMGFYEEERGALKVPYWFRYHVNHLDRSASWQRFSTPGWSPIYPDHHVRWWR